MASKIKFTKNIFRILIAKAQESDRYETIDEDKLRLDFTEEEDNDFRKYKGIENINTNSVEFAVFCEDDNNGKYIFVNNRPGYEIDCQYFESVNISFVELAVLDKAKVLRIKSDVIPEEIINTISIYDNNPYEGNTFEDLKDFFISVSAYKIDSTLTIIDDNYRIYSYFVLNYLEKSESKYSEETINEFENLIFSSIDIPYYNIYSAINSKQWSYSFLETYRLIEHVFPVTYMDLMQQSGIIGSPLDAAKVIENILGWRFNEEDATCNIFKLINNRSEFSQVLSEVLLIINDPNFTTENIGKWYYKQVRNQVVHYRSIHNNVKFTDEQWDTLLQLNLKIIQFMYTQYSQQISGVNNVHSEN